MRMGGLFVVIIGSIALVSPMASAATDDVSVWPSMPVDRIGQLLFEDDFQNDLSQWVVEQVPDGTTRIQDGWLEIDDAGGCTVWFRQQLSGPVLIEYDIVMIKADGANDHVRDLNCFWMAVDPKHPDDLFANSAARGGRFGNYDDLRLYYVGYGGNANKTTRFRRYTGTGDKPLLPEHDLKASRYLLTPNARMRIQIAVDGSTVRYARNGEVIFDIDDPKAYNKGWFGFRTVSNHMKIDRFRVYRLGDLATDSADAVTRLIGQAGNADDDAERLALLKQLRQRSDLDETLQADLDRLIVAIKQWLFGKYLPFFDRAVGHGQDYDFGISEESPLAPLLHLYRGRMITWVANENGGVWGFPDRRRRFMDRAQSHFEQTVRHYPRNRIARMYLGERYPPSKNYDVVAGAPEWAVYQRESLERLTDVIEWWIDHRQQDNGAFGGGWGDDCEMWRLWVSSMIAFDNPKITAAQAKLSRAIMTQPHMAGGYTVHVSDVQHTSEDSGDSLTPMMLLEPDNTDWSKMALRLAKLAETFWMGTNERGFRQFKSTYFSSERIDETPLKACDTFHHCRALQPLLLYWQRTGDEKLTALLTSWLDTWVDATTRTDKNKPAGILPNAIHWPDGQVGGLTDDWWDPRHYPTPSIYRWPSAMPFMTQTLLLAHHMTSDEKYLAPIRSMAAMRARYLAAPVPDAEPGSASWCARQMGGLGSTLAKYTFLTGSDEFKPLLQQERNPYVLFRLFGEQSPLTNSLASLVEILRYNEPGYTSEIRWTDRLYTFPRLLGANGIYETPMAGVSRRPYLDLLYATATGDPGSIGYFPLNAVRWLTPSRDIAALVSDAGKDRFAAELFHFGAESRHMGAELYLLSPGQYVCTLSVDSNELMRQEIEVTGPRTRIAFELPTQKVCVLQIKRR